VTQPKVTVATPAPAPAVVAPATAAAPATAPTAAAPATQTWWQALLMPVLGVVGLFLAAFLTLGLRKLTQLVEAKWNVDVPASVEQLMQDKARWAVGYVEELAQKRLLHGDGQPTPGAEKLNTATKLLEDFAASMGYGKDWQRSKIEALVEGILHVARPATASDEALATRATALTEAAKKATPAA
ncbi:hypothetical protein KJ782_06930, partial [Patescibacteria group bacterium]|nr:hypothetical protein [Patescibacteria group bacterium]